MRGLETEIRHDVERIFGEKRRRLGVDARLDLHVETVEAPPIVGENVYGEAFPFEKPPRVWVEVFPEATTDEITKIVCEELLHIKHPELSEEEIEKMVPECTGHGSTNFFDYLISAQKGFRRRSVRDVLENPREDEYYVLVTRYYPMEFRRRSLKLEDTPIDEWDRDLAPSPELLGWWKEGPRTPERWREYTRRFLEEVPPVLIRRKAGIHQGRAVGKKVVFVCMEEDWEHPYCHTWILLDSLT